MEPFKHITSKCIPVDLVNVDTDQIIPKQFLKLIQRTGFDKYLFFEWRYDNQGNKKESVFNDPNYSSRRIILARDNFGSGSSREHAAWAIRDYGIKVIVAPSFADIFYSNCFKNGILPIKLPPSNVDYLFNNPDMELEIDLEEQIIKYGSNVIHFDVESSRKQLLLEGLDEIGITLKLQSSIDNYERIKKISW